MKPTFAEWCSAKVGRIGDNRTCREEFEQLARQHLRERREGSGGLARAAGGAQEARGASSSLTSTSTLNSLPVSVAEQPFHVLRPTRDHAGSISWPARATSRSRSGRRVDAEDANRDAPAAVVGRHLGSRGPPDITRFRTWGVSREGRIARVPSARRSEGSPYG